MKSNWFFYFRLIICAVGGRLPLARGCGRGLTLLSFHWCNCFIYTACTLKGSLKEHRMIFFTRKWQFLLITLDHFTRCKQHWSRSTSCFSFLTLHKSWDKIQPTEHLKLNKKVKQTSLRCFLYMWNKENSYKLKQEVFLDQCCLHLVKDTVNNVLRIFLYHVNTMIYE